MLCIMSESTVSKYYLISCKARLTRTSPRFIREFGNNVKIKLRRVVFDVLSVIHVSSFSCFAFPEGYTFSSIYFIDFDTVTHFKNALNSTTSS